MCPKVDISYVTLFDSQLKSSAICLISVSPKHQAQLFPGEKKIRKKEKKKHQQMLMIELFPTA
jgi:hypothetical protein